MSAIKAGVEFIEQNEIKAHEIALRNQLFEGLKSLQNLQILTSDYECSSPLSFISTTMSISDLAQVLDSEFGILSRFGLHCSPSSHQPFGTFKNGGTIRLSCGFFNTQSQIDYTIDAIRKTLK